MPLVLTLLFTPLLFSQHEFPVIITHRGASEDALENTIAAFSEAMSQHTDACVMFPNSRYRNYIDWMQVLGSPQSLLELQSQRFTTCLLCSIQPQSSSWK